MIFQNSTDLLIAAAESAKMQRDAGIEDPVFKSRTGKIMSIDSIHIYNLLPERYFPIAVVEGKPVFVGDELWNVPNNFKFTAARVEGSGDNCCIWNGRKISETGGRLVDLSWNPPKPKTVMVELLREDVEWLASIWNSHNYLECAKRASAACIAALEK